VTQEQWKEIMGNNPSHFKHEKNLPVENLSWEDSQEFVKKLRGKDKKLYPLPTEAEWEYACRAGTTTDFHTGNGEDALRTAGWYYANSGKETQPVGQLAMNAWNLHDMHGNVYEWCNDWSDSYSSDKLVDPVGPDSGLHRVRRGGSWYGSARDSSQRHCWSGQRNSYAPMGRVSVLGFRVAFVFPG
jgi:formylglycine-generating enzyme required for sulfatase activity